MIEVMEPTDFAVRLEFEKGGYILPEEARFMGRGVDFAMEMIDFTPLPVEQIKEKYFCRPKSLQKEKGFEESVIIGREQTPCFSVHQVRVNSYYRRKSAGFHVGIVVQGKGEMEAGVQKIEIKKGDKFLVPFQTKEVIYRGSDLEIIFTYPPQE